MPQHGNKYGTRFRSNPLTCKTLHYKDEMGFSARQTDIIVMCLGGYYM